MAIIKQGILGGFSGSVAGVVGTSWKGRAIMKAKPLSVANPRTEEQVSQRVKFKSVATLASVLLTYICRSVYNPIAGNISGYNKFTSQNKSMFDGSGNFVFANAKIGGGTLIHDQLTSIVTADGGVTLDVAWANSAPVGSARNSDIAHCYVIEPISGNIWAFTGGNARDDESANIPLVKGGSDLMGQLQVYGFIAYTDTTGRLVSIEASGYQAEIDFGA
jgi:hypothetical protein